MSSNQILAEKLRSAREIVGFLFKKTKEDSMDEDMLDHVWNILNDSVKELVLPAPEQIVLAAPAPAPIILHTSRPPRDATVCPCPLYQSCSVCKKFEPRPPKPKNKTTGWTAERRAEQSAKMKALCAARKAQQPPATE